jgi:hypothetical protein
VDLVLRTVLLALAFLALFYPDDQVSAVFALCTLAATVFGVLRHRQIATLKPGLAAQPAI